MKFVGRRDLPLRVRCGLAPWIAAFSEPAHGMFRPDTHARRLDMELRRAKRSPLPSPWSCLTSIASRTWMTSTDACVAAACSRPTETRRVKFCGEAIWKCRYGGEELLVALPETALDRAVW